MHDGHCFISYSITDGLEFARWLDQLVKCAPTGLPARPRRRQCPLSGL
jgi:hypothetical protein